MLQHVKSAQERWRERVGGLMAPKRSVFPDDAVAVIYQPARSAMTSSKARTREWKLRFEPRSPRYVEPLMGWTGNDDMLSQVELTFPSAEAAVGYVRRQGLQYVVRGLADIVANVRQIGDAKPAPALKVPSVAPRWRLEWVERTLGSETIRNRAVASDPPSVHYAAPKEVLRDPALSEAEKRDVLRRWALDAYLIESASLKEDAVPRPSRLDEVIDALIDLDEPELRRLAARPPRSPGKEHSEAA